jgi:vacuolar-type H+-ATPase subunit F/Vma7
MTFFVLGDEDVILGFQFIGIRGKIVESAESAFEEFNNVINGKYGDIGVILLTEKVSLLIDDHVMKWQLGGNYPLIVEIPDLDGHLEGKRSLLESIRIAIGFHV